MKNKEGNEGLERRRMEKEGKGRRRRETDGDGIKSTK